jgi:anaerobic C4-dicarboxylate transporter
MRERDDKSRGAVRHVSAVSSSEWKVSILSEIAAAHAEAHQSDDARQTLRLAMAAAAGAPDDALWATIVPACVHMIIIPMDPSLSVKQALAHAQAAAYQLRKFVRRHKALVGGVLGVFTALLVGTFSSLIDG